MNANVEKKNLEEFLEIVDELKLMVIRIQKLNQKEKPEIDGTINLFFDNLREMFNQSLKITNALQDILFLLNDACFSCAIDKKNTENKLALAEKALSALQTSKLEVGNNVPHAEPHAKRVQTEIRQQQKGNLEI